MVSYHHSQPGTLAFTTDHDLRTLSVLSNKHFILSSISLTQLHFYRICAQINQPSMAAERDADASSRAVVDHTKKYVQFFTVHASFGIS